MKGKYLSEIVDINDLRQGKLNLIYAPCGAGKTMFAKTEPRKLALHDVLYLIDTAIGKEQLLHDATINYNVFTGEPYWKLDGIKVMTYAGYATLCEVASDNDYWKEDSVIVCDELQNAIQWSKIFKDSKSHAKVIKLIANKIALGNNTVIAISATPNKIKEQFNFCLYEVPLHGEPRHYENTHTEYYCNLQAILNKIAPNQKGIIYAPHVRDIIKYQTQLEAKDIKCASIWSTHKTDIPMNEDQMKIRNYIVNYKVIPDHIDVLLINKACETSISINSHIDFMIVHSTEKDSQIQVRGRYRNDLEQLYLYDTKAEQEIVVPDEYLNKPLHKTDKDALCQYFGIKDNRRLLKWTSIKKVLIDAGYEVIDRSGTHGRYSVIQD